MQLLFSAPPRQALEDFLQMVDFRQNNSANEGFLHRRTLFPCFLRATLSVILDRVHLVRPIHKTQ